MSIKLKFNHALDFDYGVLQQVAPGIRRLVAHNPSPFTFYGTGTYVIGHGKVAVIDPGPADPDHINALLAGLAPDETISHLLITHTHLDHSPGAALLQARLAEQGRSAPTYGFGPHPSPRPQASGAPVGDEGADREFVPDITVTHNELIEGAGWSVECLHTPGHTLNHLCFSYREQQALFTGDLVMGWATSVVLPHDGDMGAYLTSLRSLLEREETTYWPTHGAEISQPRQWVAGLISHREAREVEILECVRAGMTRIADMVGHMYADYPTDVHAIAGYQVLAHILHLQERGLVATEGDAALDSEYHPA